jgi:hypothetical protein
VAEDGPGPYPSSSSSEEEMMRRIPHGGTVLAAAFPLECATIFAARSIILFLPNEKLIFLAFTMKAIVCCNWVGVQRNISKVASITSALFI